LERQSEPFHGDKQKVTDMSFCLMTTFERILREESTTAAQVSSAEDSIARTLKGRLVDGNKANDLEKKCLDCIDMSLIAGKWTLE